jgi:hypothetical protein
VSRALLGSAFVRNGAVVLGILGWLFSGCSSDKVVTTPSQGVVWNRITPVQVGAPDRPDWRGDSIAFQTKVAGFDRVAVAREDGSGVAVEPEAAGVSARAPRWVTGDLLVVSSDGSGLEDLWYREVSSGVIRRLSSFGGSWTPVPRPAQPGLVYVSGASPDSGTLVLLPDTAAVPLGPLLLTQPSLAAAEPGWNPAGDQICFSVPAANGSRTIWRLSLTDTLPVQLTVAPPVNPPSGPQIDRSPRWSPDGTRILFASNRGAHWGVWTVSPLGEAQGLNVIAQDVGSAEIRHPCWSPDGTEILLSSDRAGDRALWRLSNLP